MSAIASVLAAMGHHVTGSDLKASSATSRLVASGVKVWIGHDADHVAESDLVAVSTAIGPSNPEVKEAHRRGVPVLSRAQLLAAIADCRRCVAVSGTHGKTTTTSMLALILVEAGLRPSFLIGGDVNEIGTNAVWDSGPWLVVEADESDGTFLALDPEIAVVTNIEADHLDFYGDFDALVDAFDRFCAERPGGVVAGADDTVAAEIGRRHGADTVGDVTDCPPTASVTSPCGPTGRRSICTTGRMFSAGSNFPSPVRTSLRTRRWRRWLPCGRAHPSTMQRAPWPGSRAWPGASSFEARPRAYVSSTTTPISPPKWPPSSKRPWPPEPRRLVVVFQPHRYSRIASLWEGFADAFVGADLTIVTDIFSAGEAPVPGITGHLVADARAGRPSRIRRALRRRPSRAL